MSTAATVAAAPASSDSSSAEASPASVTTVRLWTSSKWKSRSAAGSRNASTSRCTRAGSRPSDRFGTASSTRAPYIGSPGANVGRRPLDGQLALDQERLSVDPDLGVHDDAIEVDRDLDGSADRGRGAEGDVRRPQDLLVLEHVAGELGLLVRPDAELGDIRPILAVGGEEVHEERSLLPIGLHEVPGLDGQLDRLAGDADAGDRAVDDELPVRRTFDGRDE